MTYASLSAELGITSGQLKAWHLELLAAGSAMAIAQTRAEAPELAQLRRDVKRLKEENEVMRKASIFSVSGRRRHEHQARVHPLPGSALRSNVTRGAAHAHDHGIRLMCRVLDVSRSWFHAWQHTAADRVGRPGRFEELVGETMAIFEDSKQRYGAPRIHAELRFQGHQVSRKMVAKLMKLRGIQPPRRKRRMPMTTDSNHSFAIAPNLLRRNFKIMVPDTVWLADISYIPTDEDWLYLAAVKDLATMEIVGWSMSERLKSSPCEDALKMAIRNRRPASGLIIHTDRGVQYACDSYRKLLGLHHITASMSRKGNCLDNAPIESFFSSLKTEMVHRTRFQTRQAAKAALFEYIEIFDNRQRRHSSVGYRTPTRAGIDMLIKMAT